MQQREARRVRFSDEFLSQTEARQFDIATRDSVRLQREAKPGDPNSGKDEQKFDTATSKGDPENVQKLEKASIGKHYLRPVKKPTLLLDRIPQWFERVKEDLLKDRSSLIRPLPSRTKLDIQRPARYDEQLLRGRDFKRAETCHGQRGASKDKDRLIHGLDNEGNGQYEQHPNGCSSDESAVLIVRGNGRGDLQGLRSHHQSLRNNPISPSTDLQQCN